MSDELPARIDPLRLAKQGARLHGRVELSRLARLQLFLAGCEGHVEVRLEFNVDEQCIANLEGRLSAELEIECQRCLGKMKHPLQSDVCLGVIESPERARQLPDKYDPLLFKGEPLSLVELIEDELILALPQVAMHPANHCAAARPVVRGEAHTEDHPFAVLAKLNTR